MDVMLIKAFFEALHATVGLPGGRESPLSVADADAARVPRSRRFLRGGGGAGGFESLDTEPLRLAM